MRERLEKLLDSVPSLISNTRLDVRVEGWPATAAIGSVCAAVVAVVVTLFGGRRDG